MARTVLLVAIALAPAALALGVTKPSFLFEFTPSGAWRTIQAEKLATVQNSADAARTR